jgi:hypothetical protein
VTSVTPIARIASATLCPCETSTRLRKAIADLTLDKLILQEAARGNF